MEDRIRAETAQADSRDASDLAAFLTRVLTCTSRDIIWDLCSGFFRDLGFVHVAYGYSPDSRGPELGLPEDFLVMSTLPDPVIEEMVRRGFFWQSMTFRWALRNTGIASWSRSAAECGLPADFAPTREAQAFFDRHGLRNGVSIGAFSERRRGRAVFALIGPPDRNQAGIDALVDAHHDVIFTVAAVMHQCLSHLPLRIFRRNLTPRQREVLEWVAYGKTAVDIAVIMGISAPTVEKHLRLARETLGVETTAHAVIKAAFLNQVFAVISQPEDEPAPR